MLILACWDIYASVTSVSRLKDFKELNGFILQRGILFI